MKRLGRPPIHRKAMTPAQRQARRREKLKQLAKQEKAQVERTPYQPPQGYARAKGQLIAQGHVFERARREFGFEEGVFVDGAFMRTDEVIALADLSPKERQQRITERRREWKDDACGAVEGYMGAMHVSFEELARYILERKPTEDPQERRARVLAE